MSDMSSWGAGQPVAFSVTGPSDLRLETGTREGTTTFTVTNLTGRPVRARLLPMAEQGADQSWLSIEGPPEVPIPVGGTITATVKVAVATRAPAGNAMIRLDVVPEDDTESQVRGPVVSFEVPASARARGMAVLLILLIVLVLALVGGGAYYWFFIRDKPAPSSSETPTATPKPTPTKTSKKPRPSKSPTPTPTPTPKTNLTWTDPTDVGGPIISGPAIASLGGGRLEVFGLASDASLAQFTKQGTTWNGPDHPIAGPAVDRPAVVSTGGMQLTVAYLQTDGQVAVQNWNGSWTTPLVLPGPAPTINSSPTLCSSGPERMDLFARGGDNHVWHRSWTGVWDDWEQLEGEWVGAPTCVATGPDRLELFIRDGFNHLQQRSYDGIAFGAPKDLGGGMVQDVAATSWGPDRIDLFTFDGGDRLRHRFWNGTTWTNWTTIATGISDVPGAVATAKGKIAVVARSTSDTLLYLRSK